MARLSRLSRQQKHCTAEKEQRGRSVLSTAELQKHSKSSHRNKPSTTFSQPENTNTSPYHEKLLKPNVSLELEKEKLGLNQKKQKKNFDKKWSKATVTRRLDDRSYEVEASGTTHHNSRVHLKKTVGAHPSSPTWDSSTGSSGNPATSRPRVPGYY